MKTLKPYDFGKTFLVEESQQIKVSDLLALYKQKLKKLTLETQLGFYDSKIELTISKTHFGGERYWFKCPLCNKRSGVLYIHPINKRIGCRDCLRLDYRSRRYKGMIEERIISSTS